MGKVQFTQGGNFGNRGIQTKSKDFSKPRNQTVKRKNISKKEFDKVKKVKRADKIEKIKERTLSREKELALKKAEKRLKKGKLAGTRKKEDADEEEWEEVDEHEKDIFDKDGYFDVPDHQTQISANDEKLLKTLQKKREESGKVKPKESESLNLADLIMQKLANGQFQDGTDPAKKAPVRYEDLEDGVASTLDPRVVAAYKSLGSILRSYKSGKLPKLFKIMPQIANWEEVLFLTKPEQWHPCATAEATKIFCSNLNSKMVQRFYNLVLLQAVRENISTYKKLNYHLYMALKKALFKPAAFFKGFLLPLAEDDPTSREAIIVGSVLQKMSIPSFHSSAALIKLTELDYNIATGYFIKVLIGKRYALPTIALDMLLDFFCRFEEIDEVE